MNIAVEVISYLIWNRWKIYPPSFAFYSITSLFRLFGKHFNFIVINIYHASLIKINIFTLKSMINNFSLIYYDHFFFFQSYYVLILRLYHDQYIKVKSLTWIIYLQTFIMITFLYANPIFLLPDQLLLIFFRLILINDFSIMVLLRWTYFWLYSSQLFLNMNCLARNELRYFVYQFTYGVTFLRSRYSCNNFETV